MKPFVLFVLAYIILFAVIDALQRWVFTRMSWSRRATHVASGVISYFLPLYLSKLQIVAIGFGFVFILATSKGISALTMHRVTRKTWGEIFYPLAIGLMPFISLPDNPQAFQFGVLVLAFSDGLAGIVGEWAHFKPINLYGHTKSLGGSLTFFGVTFFVQLFFIGFAWSYWPAFALGSLALTLLEFILVFGTDNLLIPLFAMVYYLLLQHHFNF